MIGSTPFIMMNRIATYFCQSSCQKISSIICITYTRTPLLRSYILHSIKVTIQCIRERSQRGVKESEKDVTRTPLIFVTSFQTISAEPTQDSNELRLQDMLMLLLTPYIEEDLTNYYSKIRKDVSLILRLGKLK